MMRGMTRNRIRRFDNFILLCGNHGYRKLWGNKQKVLGIPQENFAHSLCYHIQIPKTRAKTIAPKFHFFCHQFLHSLYAPSQRGINSNQEHLNLQYLSSNEKMTLSSLLKPTDMKHLLKALITTHRAAPSPFYLLKINNHQHHSHHPDLLFLNRSLSNHALLMHQQRFSVWSPHHLHRLQNCGLNGLQNRVLLANPYKSEEFIQQALDLAITDIVITSTEEYQRIQSVKASNRQLRNKAINYHWVFADEQGELENMRGLKDVIRNVIFDWTEIRSSSRVDMLTRRILDLGCKIQKVICSGKQSQASELKRWSLQQSDLPQPYKRQIELKDVSDLDHYLLAARSKGKGPMGIDPQAQELIQPQNYAENCLMVNVEKEEWLLSRICKFPLQQQHFLYEITTKPSDSHMQIEEASAI